MTTKTPVLKPEAPKLEPKVERDNIPRIIVPMNLAFRDAAKHLIARAEQDEAVAPFVLQLPVLPWSGAYAIEQLLMRSYTATFQGTELQAPSKDGRVTVRWGKWTIAGLGELLMDVDITPKGYNLKVVVRAQRLMRTFVETLFDEIRAEAAKRDLYAGTALILAPDEDGNLTFHNPPEVVLVPQLEPKDLILSDYLTRQVNAELLLPIAMADKLEKNGLPTRRGVLLAGLPGTGKTMSSKIAARLAINRGWTVFYLPDARGLEQAISIAQANSPAVLICEDLDRQLGGDRDALTDRILNALDGMDRSAKLVLIATTNAPENLPAPLLRPGRLDSCIMFEPPDAQAAVRMLRKELRGQCPEELPIEVGKLCEGLLHACLKEVATRAILHSTLDESGVVTHEHILDAATSVRRQQEYLEAANKPKEKKAKRLDITVRPAHAADALADGSHLHLLSNNN